jgi:uncharacterized membrane protein YjgN (DUF898 family)
MNFGPCPKCGLMQILRDKCRSCGKPLDVPKGQAYVKSEPPPIPDRPLLNAGRPPEERVSPSSNPEPPPLAREEAAVAAEPSPKKAEPGEIRRPSFKGTGGALCGIQLVNTLLTIVTLGFYSFWGKTKIRNYLWSQTELEGDRFVYHGTGMELMTGFFKVMIFFAVPLLLLEMAPMFMGPGIAIKVIAKVLAVALFIILIPMALAGARRYRLSRTSWRGIRFSFRGANKDFVALFLGGGFLTAITLGFYYPFFDARRQEFMVNNAYFGNRSFRFDGHGRDLVKPFLVALLLAIPTLGISWVWFMAARQRYFWEHTRLDDVRFECTVTGARLLGLYLTNFVLLLVTLGMAWSWVMVRNINFSFSYLTLKGGMDLAKVRQEAQTASATGDMLAGFVDAGLDVGY